MEYKEGDIITYRAFGGLERTGKVSYKSDDIKNGRPGFDLESGFWGYDYQITHVNYKAVQYAF